MDNLLKELVERLQKAHGDRLVSVILYGSAASEDGKDRMSDLNILSVLKAVTPDELGNAESVFRWWREKNNPAPLLLSREEVFHSTDCFPIEFHDMRDRRQVLFGEDVIKDLQIDYSFYRAQVEHELRSKLLRLRQKAGGVLSDSDMLYRLMSNSLSTFCVLFRHAILLAGGESRYEKREVMAAAARQFGVDQAPMLELLDVREGKSDSKPRPAATLFSEYLKQIDRVLEHVDRLEK